MTHLREQDRRKHRPSDCRKGRHAYGETQYIGAGITRRVCETCGDVTIDLTAAHEPAASMADARRSIRSESRRSIRSVTRR
jgi:hypothetical protein